MDRRLPSHREPSPYDEAERKRIRREKWQKEQELLKLHEARKRALIEEYERKHREKMAREKQSRRSRSKSRSKSRSSDGSSRKSRTLDQPSTSSKSQIFQGPSHKIPIEELRIVKIDIHRNLSKTDNANENIVREIDRPEEVVLSRRKGEGAKPIFQREDVLVNKDAERRVKTPPPKRPRSASGSPRRHHRSKSPRTGSRYESSRAHHSKSNHTENRERRTRSRDRGDHGEYKSSRRSSSDRTGDRRERSYSRDRHSSSNYKRKDSYHDDQRSRRSEDERDRRERDILPHHYMEPVPFPYYYPNLYRPMIVDPMMPIRAHLPVPILPGGIPPMMRHPRPYFKPPFIPSSTPGSYRYPRFQGRRP